MIRFLAFSLLLHLALLAPIYFLLKPAAAPEIPPLEYSAGEVFVGQNPAALPSTIDDTKSEPAVPAAAEEKVASPQTSPGAAALGIPDAEAALSQHITLSYPALSVRLGESGLVTVGFMISAEGRPEGMKITRSSGFSRLDAAALEALKSATYAPAIREGVPVKSPKELTVEFRLQKSGAPANVEVK